MAAQPEQRRHHDKSGLELRRQLAHQKKIIDVTKQIDSHGGEETYQMMLDSKENRTEEPDSQGLERIHIQKVLGHGGFGIVYKAETSQNATICIKTAIHKRPYHSEEDRVNEQKKLNRSLLLETEFFEKLAVKKHENIISMLFCGVSRDHNEVFLALEHSPGISLSRFIKYYMKHTPPSKLVYKVVLECSLAIKHLHSLHIAHCDIKPSNVLFESMESPIKVIDLGCAFDMQEESVIGKTPGGTYEYMSPELLLNGLAALQPGSDIYCLGGLMFTLMLQKVPWSHSDLVRKAWESPDRHEAERVIQAEHLKYTSQSESTKQTDLQSILKEAASGELQGWSDELQLVADMLSFNHWDRPSPDTIVERVGIMQQQKKHPVKDEDDLNALIPLTIPHSAPSNTGEEQTTLSSEVKRAIAQGPLSTASDLKNDMMSFGPPSDQLPEGLQEEYSLAIVEENQTVAERMDKLWIQLEMPNNELKLQMLIEKYTLRKQTLRRVDEEEIRLREQAMRRVDEDSD